MSNPTSAPTPLPARALFLYGTLLCPPLLAWLLTGDYRQTDLVRSLSQPAVLYGYVRTALHGADYPALIPSEDPEDCVRGLLLRPQTASQRRKADDFEGETYLIEPVKVKLLRDADRAREEPEVEADAYVWAGDEGLVDRERVWDPKVFEKDKLDDWLELFSGREMVG